MDWPPSFLVESLFRQKKEKKKKEKKIALSGTTNPFGDNESSTALHSTPMYPSGYPPIPSLYLPPYHLYYPQLPPQPQSDLMALFTYKEKKQIEQEKREEQQQRPNTSKVMSGYTFTAFASGLRAMELRSSPVQEDLEDYIQWHIWRQPWKLTTFYDAFEKLDTAGYDVQTIQTWKGNAYKQK